MSKPDGSCRPRAAATTEIALLGGIGSLRGVHNAQNAACASGAALALGLSIEQIQKGLRSFPGLAHRMEEVGRKGRVLFVNDSKATNADSSAQALACFSDIFWIAGGKPKTGGLVDAHRFLPAHPQGLSDRRGGGVALRPSSTARCRMWSPARSTARSRSPPAMPRRRMSPSRWCCSRRPAPRSTSTAISRCAATPSGKLVLALPGLVQRSGQ